MRDGTGNKISRIQQIVHVSSLYCFVIMAVTKSLPPTGWTCRRALNVYYDQTVQGIVFSMFTVQLLRGEKSCLAGLKTLKGSRKRANITLRIRKMLKEVDLKVRKLRGKIGEGKCTAHIN